MAEVASAVVSLMPSFKGATSAIQSELDDVIGKPSASRGPVDGEGWGKGFVRAAGSLLGPLLAGFTAGAITSFFSGAVDEASGLNESLNALRVTYGDNADAVAQLGTEAADNLGMSNLEFNNLAVRFSSFANTIAGEGGNVTGTLDDLSTRAADFASVMNLDVADSAALFQSALAGESEPLRQYGIDVSAAAVQAYAYANGIAETGTTLTEQQRIQATYGALMEQTAATQGDFANTSDQLANQQRILESRLADSKAELGQAFLPALAAVTGFMASAVGPAFDVLIGAVRGAMGGLQAFGKWASANQGTLTVIAAVVGGILVPVFIRLGVQATIAAARQVAAWALAGGGAVKAGALYIVTSAQMVGGWIRAGAAATVNAAKQVAAWVVAGTGATVNAAKMAVAWLVGVIGPAAAATAAMVANVARQVAAWVLLGVQSLIQAAKVAAAWLIAMGPIGLIIAAVIAAVALIIANWDKVKAFLAAAWEAIKSAAATAWNGIKAFFASAIAAIVSLFMNWSLPGLLIKHWDSIKATITRVWDAIVGFFRGIPSKITGALNALGGLASKVGAWFGSAKDAAVAKFDGLISWVKNIPSRITGALGNMGNLLRNAGRAIIDGFLNGLKASWGKVTDFVGGLASWIANNKGPLPYDRVLLKPAGQAIMQGLRAGLMDEMGNLDRTLSTITNAIGGTQFAASAALSGSATPGGGALTGADLASLGEHIVSGVLGGADTLSRTAVWSNIRSADGMRQTAGVLR